MDQKPGYWRLPTKDELELLGTDPPSYWESGLPTVPWTIPGAPFTNVVPSLGLFEYGGWWSVQLQLLGRVHVHRLKREAYSVFTSTMYVWPVHLPTM